MKILLVSSYLPYPLFSGGHIRLFNLLRGLSKNHKITLICEQRDYQTGKDVKEVAKFCQEVITVPRIKQWSLSNILKTGFSLKPFLLVGHTNSRMREKIRETLEKKKFDLIHFETFYVMQNLPPTRLPIVLAEHNIEYLVYQRFAKIAPLFLKLILWLDILKLKYWERKFWQKATKLIAVSKEDRKIMKREDAAIVPNGVDLNQYQISPLHQDFAGQANVKSQISKGEKTALFIGDFKWIENQDSARWLLSEIWPHFVRQSLTSRGKSKLKLWIVGKKIPESIKKMGDESVIFDENAPEETNLIYEKADFLLAPIRVGGGTKFKILEAMASGVLVISTPLGIEGLGVKDGQEVLIAKNSQEFAGQILAILENPVKYQQIIQSARKLIEKNYDWEIIVKKLEKVYQSVV